jgi:hypothetical protein
MSDGIDLSEIIFINENDPGIRPAGKKDECFYCKMKVGDYHNIDCVILTKKNKYSILVDDKVVAKLLWDDPIAWDNDQCDFHKNEASWCVDNALPYIKWLDTEESKSASIKWNQVSSDKSCGCFFITLRCDEPLNLKKD